MKDMIKPSTTYNFESSRKIYLDLFTETLRESWADETYLGRNWNIGYKIKEGVMKFIAKILNPEEESFKLFM